MSLFIYNPNVNYQLYRTSYSTTKIKMVASLGEVYCPYMAYLQIIFHQHEDGAGHIYFSNWEIRHNSR